MATHTVTPNKRPGTYKRAPRPCTCGCGKAHRLTVRIQPRPTGNCGDCGTEATFVAPHAYAPTGMVQRCNNCGGADAIAAHFDAR